MDHEKRRGSAQLGEKNRMFRSFVGVSVAVLVVAVLMACGATGGEPDAEDAELVPQGRTIYVNAADRPMIKVSRENPGYQQVFQFLNGDGSHEVSDERWLQVLDILDWATATPEREATLDAEEARWQERQVHSANVSAFLDKMDSFNTDRVIDRTELDEICFLRAQWEDQLTAARDYVRQYRRDDPDRVTELSGLGSLQERAEQGLETVKLAGSACP